MNNLTQDNYKTLNDLFTSELADLYDAEHRIAKSMPIMAKAAISEDLRQTILKQSQSAGKNISDLEHIFKIFGTKSESRTRKATTGLIKEAEEVLANYSGSPCIDAALVLAIQKIIHYEIASYGCLHAWATLLDQSKAAGLTGLILEEKNAVNYQLGDLADSKCNITALSETPDLHLLDEALSQVSTSMR